MTRKDALNNLKKNWYLITTAYFILGMVSSGLYFLRYNINILTFIDITEILTFWFPQSFILLLMMSMPIALYIGLRYLSPSDMFNDYYPHIILRFSAVCAFIYVNLIVFRKAGHLTYQESEYLKGSIPFWVIDFFLLTFLGAVVPGIIDSFHAIFKLFKRKTHEFSWMDSKLAVIVLIIIAGAFSLFPTSMSDYLAKDYNLVTIYYGQKKVRNNFNLFYVGKTKNYIFFYNKITHQSKAFNISNADLITIENYKPFKK